MQASVGAQETRAISSDFHRETNKLAFYIPGLSLNLMERSMN